MSPLAHTHTRGANIDNLRRFRASIEDVFPEFLEMAQGPHDEAKFERNLRRYRSAHSLANEAIAQLGLGRRVEASILAAEAVRLAGSAELFGTAEGC